MKPLFLKVQISGEKKQAFFPAWRGATLVLAVMALLLSACDAFCDVVPSLPSCKSLPATARPSITSSRPTTANRTVTVVRSVTPVRTMTPTQLSAVTKVKAVLTSNTNFEKNLDALSTQVSALASSLSSLNSAKTALAVIDSIKSKNCVVGSCWTVLTTALDAVVSGSGSALSQLDTQLRNALAFKAKVDAVGSLTNLRNTASSFRNSSTSSTLSSLLSNVNAKLPALKALNQDISTLKNMLNTIKTSVDMVSEALRAAKNIASIPYLSELTSAVEKVRVATNSAYSAVSSAVSPLSSSASVMDSILAASK